jgi:hypothetical protein
MNNGDRQMARFDLDLTRNLTTNRMPEQFRQMTAHRLIIWEIDQDTGSKMLVDIAEGGSGFAVHYFNKMRKQWAQDGFQVSLEQAVYQ